MSDELMPGWELVEATDKGRRLFRNPKVRAGLRAFAERYERFGGNIPTISAEEARRRLASGPTCTPGGTEA